MYVTKCCLFQCEYLLSGRDEVLPDDINDSLDTNSPLYKALMDNPVIHLGLCNPRNIQGDKICFFSSPCK